MDKSSDMAVIMNFQNNVVKVIELAQEVEDAMNRGASVEELSGLIESLKFQAQIKLTENFRKYREVNRQVEKANEEYVKRKVWRRIE